MTVQTHQPDCVCLDCMRVVDKVFGELAPDVTSQAAIFRISAAMMLGFDDPEEVSPSEVLSALRKQGRRLGELEHQLAAVEEMLAGDDVDGARRLLSARRHDQTKEMCPC